LPKEPAADGARPKEPRTDATDPPAPATDNTERNGFETWIELLRTMPRSCGVSGETLARALSTVTECSRCHDVKPHTMHGYRFKLSELHNGTGDENELETTKRRLREAEARLASMQQLSESRSDRPSSTERQESAREENTISQLDLAERYLRAAADLKLARARLDLMSKDDGAHSTLQIDEAKIELERAEKLKRVLTTYARGAIDESRIALSIAEDKLSYTEKLVKKGYATESELNASGARVELAKSRLKQFESILSETETGN